MFLLKFTNGNDQVSPMTEPCTVTSSGSIWSDAHSLKPYPHPGTAQRYSGRENETERAVRQNKLKTCSQQFIHHEKNIAVSSSVTSSVEQRRHSERASLLNTPEKLQFQCTEWNGRPASSCLSTSCVTVQGYWLYSSLLIRHMAATVQRG